jgi:phosphoribosylformylglycinamidine (FGAM) synthase-like amidotransferase family enzyme
MKSAPFRAPEKESIRDFIRSQEEIFGVCNGGFLRQGNTHKGLYYG